MFLSVHTQGYRQRGAYIATQGPLESTVSDFWRMIWEHGSCCIVMLCDLQEDGKVSDALTLSIILVLISSLSINPAFSRNHLIATGLPQRIPMSRMERLW